MLDPTGPQDPRHIGVNPEWVAISAAGVLVDLWDYRHGGPIGAHMSVLPWAYHVGKSV